MFQNVWKVVPQEKRNNVESHTKLGPWPYRVKQCVSLINNMENLPETKVPTKKQLNKERKKQRKKEAKEKARRERERERKQRNKSALVVFGGRKSVPIPPELLYGERGEWKIAEPEFRPTVEQDHVMNVYNSVARSWNSTRYKAWPKVAEFIEAQPLGMLSLKHAI